VGRLRPRKSARVPRRVRARRACTVPAAATAQEEADMCVPPSLAFGLRARKQHLPFLSADIRTRREMTMVGNWQRWGNAGVGAGQEDAGGMGGFHEAELAGGVVQANALVGRSI
jgi:hypothetical protein